jgi:hypothetical protein
MATDEPDGLPKPPKQFPETADDFTEAAEWYDARFRFHSAQAATFAQLRDRSRSIAESMRSGDGPRIILRHDATVDTTVNVDLDTRGKSEAVRRAAGRATRQHPALKKFYEHNVTVGQVAQRLGEGRPRVSSWMAAEDPRPIPRRCQKLLEKWYGVPESAWKNIKD